MLPESARVVNSDGGPLPAFGSVMEYVMNIEDDTPEIVIDDELLEGDELEIDDEISFGDDEPETDDAPDLPKKLRNEIKERDRQLVVMRQKLEDAQKTSAPAPVEVGPKPRLEEFDYDEDKHGAALDEWSDRKVQAAIQQQTATSDDGLVEEAQADVAKFQQGIQSLTFADAKAVTESVGEAMPAALQYVVAAVAIDSATFMYALGKHPAKLQELLAIKNPTKQIAAIVRMEASMKVGQSRKAPEPDRASKGNASAAIKPDKELARLEAEADKSGNRNAVLAYKRNLKAA